MQADANALDEMDFPPPEDIGQTIAAAGYQRPAGARANAPGQWLLALAAMAYSQALTPVFHVR